MPQIRIATYNLNNLFERARLMQLEGFSGEGAKILADVQQLTGLLESDSYADPVGAEIIKLLEKYEFHKRNAPHPWFFINEVRGSLYIVKQDESGVKLAAKGRKGWVGWIELVRVPVNETSTDNTARVLKAVNADINCLVEVDSRLTLDRFNQTILKKIRPAYAHNMLIDGNDPRGIDVGIMTNFELRSIRTHIDDTYKAGNGKVVKAFSRDCAEYEVMLAADKPLWLLCNHFKSKSGNPKSNDARRTKQADRVQAILGRFDLTKELIVVAGDFNDTPTSKPLKKLLATANLFDVLTSPKFSGPRWTFDNGKDQFDYLLVSKPLFEQITAVGIERRGIFRVDTTPFPEVTNKITQASDHAAVWADFNL